MILESPGQDLVDSSTWTSGGIPEGKSEKDMAVGWGGSLSLKLVSKEGIKKRPEFYNCL